MLVQYMWVYSLIHIHIHIFINYYYLYINILKKIFCIGTICCIVAIKKNITTKIENCESFYLKSIDEYKNRLKN